MIQEETIDDAYQEVLRSVELQAAAVIVINIVCRRVYRIRI